MNFLTNRKQYVRTETTLYNNWCPSRVCTASIPIYYLHKCPALTLRKVKVSNTAILGLIHNYNNNNNIIIITTTTTTRRTITIMRKNIQTPCRSVTSWCNENYLDLNVRKTKQIIRKNKDNKVRKRISSTSVGQVSYKYRGVIIQNSLKLNAHVTTR